MSLMLNLIQKVSVGIAILTLSRGGRVFLRHNGQSEQSGTRAEAGLLLRRMK